jgi:hypothetical protein
VRFSDPKYADISKPEEANGLEEVKIYGISKAVIHSRVSTPRPTIHIPAVTVVHTEPPD